MHNELNLDPLEAAYWEAELIQSGDISATPETKAMVAKWLSPEELLINIGRLEGRLERHERDVREQGEGLEKLNGSMA